MSILNLPLELAQRDLAETERAIERIVLAIREAGHSQALLGDLAQLEADKKRLTEKAAALESAVTKPVNVRLEVSRLRQAVQAAQGVELGRILRGWIEEISVRAERKGGKVEGRIVYELVSGEARAVEYYLR